MTGESTYYQDNNDRGVGIIWGYLLYVTPAVIVLSTWDVELLHVALTHIFVLANQGQGRVTRHHLSGDDNN